ncbi:MULTISPECIES: GREB1-related protein [Muribaculaceae]|uniref:TET-Associated Glycosyltransferase domain-containing protein n=2 Tax=Muribaculaceae TaxID=2005473 RepID=A0A4Z0V3L6_9BACT|nr:MULTISPECIES: hypothetical protein [Muribaculaceae]QCD37177.1 hypothetical protein E7746_14650 [Muribaculum gordoncarteri]TGG35101.1 hypothetical protein EZ315_15560 [Duncaniella freteri]
MMKNKNFVAFILSHGRADRVVTYDSLKKSGYTGRIVIVLDNEDPSAPEYISRFGNENVVIFDKAAIAETFDEGVPGDRRTIVYARNACFDIAKKLGYRYFIELDDDYTVFEWRFDNRLRYITKDKVIRNLDAVFDIMLDFFKKIPAKSIAMAQGGDYLGGGAGGEGKQLRTKRKAMNSFICDTERRFTFLGRINEDVNTYTRNTSTGDLFLQIQQICLLQKQTQSNAGGMTEVYLDSGTYLKSFFTVMYQPSSVKVRTMGNEYVNQKRLHHRVNWTLTAPKIIREKYKKKE